MPTFEPSGASWQGAVFSEPGKLRMNPDWNNFTWPPGWAVIEAKNLVQAYSQIVILKKRFDTTELTYTRDDPASEDFIIQPGDSVSLYASAEFELAVICGAGETQTQTCPDGSTIVTAECNAQFQWVYSGALCPEQPTDILYLLLLIAGGLAVAGTVIVLTLKKR